LSLGRDTDISISQVVGHRILNGGNKKWARSGGVEMKIWYTDKRRLRERGITCTMMSQACLCTRGGGVGGERANIRQLIYCIWEVA